MVGLFVFGDGHIAEGVYHMTATAARIGFITNGYRRSIAEDTTVKDRYGTLARESDDPVETYFDNVEDALLMAQERLVLLSADRRRFNYQLAEAQPAFDLDYRTLIPVAQLTDTERGVDRKALVSEITVDLGTDTAAFLVWG